MSELPLQSWLDAVRCGPRECCLAYAQQSEFLLEAYAAGGRQRTLSGGCSAAYMHVPFCRTAIVQARCVEDARWDDAPLVNGYLDALERQAEADTGRRDKITAVEIGGGLPSILPMAQLQRLTRIGRSLLARGPETEDTVRRPDSRSQLSIATSPRIAATEAEKMKMLSEAGVGRIVLRLMGPESDLAPQRGQRLRESCAIKAVEDIRAAGIPRLNCELAFGCPGQTPEDWRNELKLAVQLQPDAMTITPCVFSKGQHDSSLAEPTTLAQFGTLYDLAYDFLTARGFVAPYASIHFSRKTGESGASAYFECRQREGLSFLGLGNFAEGLLENQWQFRRMLVDDYVAASPGELAAAQRRAVLPLAECVTRYVAESLDFGVLDTQAIRRLFGIEATATFADAFELAQRNDWLKPLEGGVWGVPFGQFRSIGYLRSLFYTDRCRLWLLRHYVAPRVSADAATFANAP